MSGKIRQIGTGAAEADAPVPAGPAAQVDSAPPADAPEAAGDTARLARDIINMMEQGILYWSPEGICRFHNARVHELLELAEGDLRIGTTRPDFLGFAERRGEFDAATRRKTEERFHLGIPFSFDRQLPSGRIVATYVRPARGGGYVVTFTDVSEAREDARALARAKEEALAAEARMREILASERARQSEQRQLGQLDEWLQSCRSLSELFTIVETFMERLLPGSAGELYIYSNSRDVLDGSCTWGDSQMHESIAPDSCWALRRGRAYLYDVEGISFLCDHVHEDEDDPIRSYICVPIVAHGDTVGLMHIRLPDDPVEGIDDPTIFAKRCGEHISMAIANVKLRDELHDQSIRDPLTGLYNRRYFVEALRRDLARLERDGRGVALVAFDADHFKSFNDSHGHDAGDVVLRVISDTAREVIGDEGIVCRMGGEEFAVLLPGVNLTEAMHRAEDLRSAIASAEVRYADSILPKVTVSLGVAAAPVHGQRGSALLKAADRALYAAKDSGRNCVAPAEVPRP